MGGTPLNLVAANWGLEGQLLGFFHLWFEAEGGRLMRYWAVGCRDAGSSRWPCHCRVGEMSIARCESKQGVQWKGVRRGERRGISWIRRVILAT